MILIAWCMMAHLAASAQHSGSSEGAPVRDSAAREFLLPYRILAQHPYFNFSDKPQQISYTRKQPQEGREVYFYLLAGILLLFAALRTIFRKYFDDLMALFFRRGLKQRQLKQQVSQNELPSLLLNILFVIVGGYYLALLSESPGGSKFPFWQLAAYGAVFIALLYVAKYLVLKLIGWMLQVSPLTDSYIFVVFLINKIAAVALLPVIVIASLGSPGLMTIMLALSWMALAALFTYRSAQAFSILRKSKGVGAFHFLLYLLSFEILPAAVIYKAMTGFLD